MKQSKIKMDAERQTRDLTKVWEQWEPRSREEEEMLIRISINAVGTAMLVSSALERHGFGNGEVGITYPGDLDEYDIKVEKVFIPDGYVEVSGLGRPPEGYEFLVPEKHYLYLLSEFLREQGNSKESEFVRNLSEKCAEPASVFCAELS